MRVTCDVGWDLPLVNDRGQVQRGVIVTCERCGHTAEAFGVSDRSVRRCLAELRETCPKGECNYYTTA